MPPGHLLTTIEVGRTAAEGPGQLRRFRYDTRGRLAQIVRQDDSDDWAAFFTYAYDSDGNRRVATDAENRSTRFGYDLGNPTVVNQGFSDERRFTYDRINRLRCYEDDATGADVSYAYDPFGCRVLEQDAGGTTWFLWDGDQLLAEFDATGARERRYAYAGGFVPLQMAETTSPPTETIEVSTRTTWTRPGRSRGHRVPSRGGRRTRRSARPPSIQRAPRPSRSGFLGIRRRCAALPRMGASPRSWMISAGKASGEAS